MKYPSQELAQKAVDEFLANTPSKFVAVTMKNSDVLRLEVKPMACVNSLDKELFKPQTYEARTHIPDTFWIKRDLSDSSTLFFEVDGVSYPKSEIVSFEEEK